jgi:hypothetical protein
MHPDGTANRTLFTIEPREGKVRIEISSVRFNNPLEPSFRTEPVAGNRRT